MLGPHRKDSHPTVLVIAADRGIGRGLARAFKARGWCVIATVEPGNAETPFVQLLKIDEGGLLMEMDYTDEESIEEVTNKIAEHDTYSLDVVVNCAGLEEAPAYSGHLYEGEPNLLERIQTMVAVPILITKRFMPHLMKEDGPVPKTLVYVMPNPRTAADATPSKQPEMFCHSMARSSVLAQAKALDSRNREHGIRVNTLLLETAGADEGDVLNESSISMVRLIESMTPEMSGTFINWTGDPVY
ncbi:hypothetical protein B0T22DRAFT_477154 [Podospora appendiculata]|uniref:Uncharacterized protein n=1 Tax=Podospora appendiculata TaxID=314037 RepID=A0AAE0XK40_9PEZI|nr:hypothetical protein B0T22DRAFT_477154 [Podospora appendiculata]